MKKLNKKTHYKKICRSCGQYYSDDYAETEICEDCRKKYKGQKVPYKCTCGKVFLGQAEFRKHRSENMKAGKPCPPYKIFETMINCPYCGKEISNSSDTRAGKETLYTHYKVCPERPAIIAQYGSHAKTPMAVKHKQESMQSIEYIIAMLTSKKLEDTTVTASSNKTYSTFGSIVVGSNTMAQNLWLSRVLEENNKNYVLRGCNNRASSIQNVILELEIVFNFDNQLIDYFKPAFEKANWKIVDITWADCILKPEEVEKTVIEAILEQEGKFKIVNI